MDKVVQLTPVTCRCDALLHSVSTWLAERFDRCMQDVAFAEVQVRLLIGFKCFIRELVNDLNVLLVCDSCGFKYLMFQYLGL